MDDQTLDAVARAVGRARSRRSALTLAAAAAVTVPALPAAAKHKKPKHRCRKPGKPCDNANPGACCSGTCDALEGNSCGPCAGKACASDADCCGGTKCLSNRCGGCWSRAVTCANNTDCCFSDCSGGACYSLAGGSCFRNSDCKSCYLNAANCPGACVKHVCQR